MRARICVSLEAHVATYVQCPEKKHARAHCLLFEGSAAQIDADGACSNCVPATQAGRQASRQADRQAASQPARLQAPTHAHTLPSLRAVTAEPPAFMLFLPACRLPSAIKVSRFSASPAHIHTHRACMWGVASGMRTG